METVQMKIYTMGEVLDNIKVNQVAIMVKGGRIGKRVYVDARDNNVLKDEDWNAIRVSGAIPESDKSRWIIIDR